MQARARSILLALLAGALLLFPGSDPRAQAAAKRPQFAYVLRVAPAFREVRDWSERERAIVARHFERLARATEAKQVILAGRSTERLAETFGVVIFEADDAAAARRFMEADPAIAGGLMTATLQAYAVVLQRRRAAE